MTSKISLRKLVMSDLKRRSWLVILISLAGVFIFPFMYSMRLTYARDQAAMMAVASYGPEAISLAERYYYVAEGFFHPSGGLIVFIAAVAGVLAAFTGFSWLHSREQTDFYAGMPVRRVSLFLAPYLSGILIAVIPYIVCTLLALLGVGAAFGNVTGRVLSMAVPGLIWGIVGYLAVYTAAVFAMLLTGRPVIGLCMMGLLGFYGPVFHLLITFLEEDCFSTFFSRGSTWMGGRFSPLFVILRAASSPLDGFLLIIYLVVFFCLCVLVMERRPMEKAETSFVHPFIAPCVKVLTAIPAAMYTGFLVGETIGPTTDSLKWEIFWCFAAALGYNVVYELIMSTDVKNLLGHWRSAALAFAGVLIFVCIFPLDLLGYDRFLPEESKIEAMALDSYSIYQCYSEEVFQGSDAVFTDGRSQEEVLMEETLTENFGPIYELAREGVLRPAADNEETSSIAVCYRLKSGRDVFRRYVVKTESVKKAVAALTEDEDYRRKASPFRYLNEQFLREVTLTGWTLMGESTRSFKLDDSDMQTLIDCLREDGAAVDAGTLLETRPVASLTCDVWYEDEPDIINLRSMTNGILIYPQYTRTLAFFEARGGIPDHEEKTEDYEKLAVWDQDTYYVLTDPADIEVFLACTERPWGIEAGNGKAGIYVEATFSGNAGTYSGNARVTDQASYRRLLDKVLQGAA